MSKQFIEKDWSCGLEDEEYEKDIQLLIKDALEAVRETGQHHFVNLVTPSVHGHPDKYLVPILSEEFGNQIKMEFIDQCGCGGYVLKVTKR